MLNQLSAAPLIHTSIQHVKCCWKIVSSSKKFSRSVECGLGATGEGGILKIIYTIVVLLSFS
jgi:hypothetical protein